MQKEVAGSKVPWSKGSKVHSMGIRVFHCEDSAYTGYILVLYSSGINYLFLIRLIINNRQAQLKNNFYSVVPSNVDLQKQLWDWKKIYVTFFKLCGISTRNQFLFFLRSFEKIRMTSENSDEIKEVTDLVASALPDKLCQVIIQLALLLKSTQEDCLYLVQSRV